jgi:hypothetical protein
MFCAPGHVFDDTEDIGSRFHVLRAWTYFPQKRGCEVPFSYFALPKSFPRYQGRWVPFLSFALADSFLAVPRALGHIFMLCAHGLVFGGTEGVDSHFHVLLSRNRFRRYRGRRLPFSSFALPDSFSVVPWASGPVLMFCAPGLIFGGTEGVGSRFHLFRALTRFHPVPRALGPIFMLCAPRLIFSSTEGVRSRFHVLRCRTCFLRCRVRRVSISCFVRPDPFSSVPRATGSVFMFCAPRLVLGGTEGVRSRFQVLRSRTHFRWNRGHQVLCFMFLHPDSFSTVPRKSSPVLYVLFSRTRFQSFRGRRLPFSAVSRTSGPVFKFCAPGFIFDSTEGVRSRFHFLRSRTCFFRCRVHRVPFSCFVRPDSFSTAPRATGSVFMYCSTRLVFGGTEGVGSPFHILHSRTCFQRYGGRRVPFSCFTRLDLSLVETRVLGPILIFCAPGVVSRGTEGVGSRFQVLRSRTHFWQYRGHWIMFSHFARTDSFSAVPRALTLVFMFCAPGLVFGGTGGVGSHFHVLRAWTHFRPYQGHRVPFSCFARPDPFSAVSRMSGTDFMFCAPGHIFDGNEGVVYHF